MTEKDIEKYLVRKMKELGSVAYKFASPGHDGVPDRLVCLPGGRVLFVELKAPGRKPRPLQEMEIRRLRDLGFRVYVIDCIEGVDALASRIQDWEPLPHSCDSEGKNNDI